MVSEEDSFLAGYIFEEPEVHEEDSVCIQMLFGNIWVLGDIRYFGYGQGLEMVM